MKKNLKLAFSALLVMAFGLAGCGNNAMPSPSQDKSEVTGITFEGLEHQAQLTLEIGETYTLTPVITYKSESSDPVTPIWSNSNKKVTSLNSGLVAAIGYGKSTISARAGKFMASVTFTVPNHETPATFTLNRESLNLAVGGSFQLVASYNEQEVTAQWSVNNDHVTVTNGLVTASSVGQSIVTASYNNKTATCTVIVSEQGEFEISLSPANASLTVGQTLQLTATTSVPATVTYTSSSAAASVDSNGLVTANSVGNAVITASANGKSATCNVTVSAQPDPQKNATVYFFIDFNNADPDDETGTKRLAMFPWYQNQPLKTAPIPEKPADSLAPDRAFPYFIGWSAHSIIDSKDDLWDMDTDTLGTAYVMYIFGIWSDVPASQWGITA